MPSLSGKPCSQLELYQQRMGFNGQLAVSAVMHIHYFYKQQLLLLLLT